LAQRSLETRERWIGNVYFGVQMSLLSETLKVMEVIELDHVLVENALPTIQKTLLNYWKKRDGIASDVVEHCFILNNGIILGNIHKDLTHTKIISPIVKNGDDEGTQQAVIASGAIRVFLEDFGDVLYVNIEYSGNPSSSNQKSVLGKFIRGEIQPVVLRVETFEHDGCFVLDSNSIGIPRMLRVLFSILDGKIKRNGKYWSN